MKRNVCLVYPECYEMARFGTKRKEFPPFGVMYLASSLEKEGYDVTIKAASLEHHALDFRNYDLVGFSISSSAAYPLILKTRKSGIYKENSILVAGGIHASLYPLKVLNELNVDIISYGEGEKTICEIASHLEDRDFSEIKGIYYKNENEIIQTEKNQNLNLDELPFPGRHLLPKETIVMKRLSDTDLSIAHILFTRGCPYHCNFCANQNHNIRYRSKENIKEELEFLMKNYSIQGFCVTDDNFLVIKEKAIPIVEEISDLNLKWSTLARVDNVDLSILEKLKASGCIEIKYGVETGSQILLNKMNKKITIEEIKKAFYLTKKVGLKTKALIMHGYPGENMKTTEETIHLLEELKEYIGRIGLTYFTYLPGAPIYPENTLLESHGVYCDNQVPWGTKEEQQEVLLARKKLQKYIKENFPEK